MIKIRNKKISMLLVIAMLMTMFVGVGSVSAASVTYTTDKTGDVSTGLGKDLGIITVNIPEISVMSATYGEYLSVTLPEGMTFATNVPANYYDLGNEVALDPTYGAGNITGDSRTMNLKLLRAAAASEKAIFQIVLRNINVQDASGDISVLVGGPYGGLFPTQAVTLGQAVSKGATNSVAKSVKTMGDQGCTLDTFLIIEKMTGTLYDGDVIKLRLPNGFTWSNAGTLLGDWGLATKATYNVVPTTGGRDLVFELNLTGQSTDQAGRLAIGGLAIAVDDATRYGDVNVTVSKVSGTGNITTQDVPVAKYGTFKITVTEDKVAELTAGKSDCELGSFLLNEEVAGSLVAGRTLTLEVPSGVKWEKAPEVTAKKGSNLTGTWSAVSGSKNRIIKTTLTGSISTPSKMLFEKGKVSIEPGFKGPIEITIGGKSGAEDNKVKVANVTAAVEMTAVNVKDITLGTQKQQVGDILIKELAKEAILSGTNHDKIVVSLDNGYTFAQKPKVEVAEGDLQIDSTKLNSDNDELTITMKYDSSKASTIKISEVFLTGLRYAPEGTVKAFLKEAEGDVGVSATGSTALDEGFDNSQWVTSGATVELSEVSAGQVVIANCITPAQETATAKFKIDSNIYEVNGVAKVMDAAPYIKGSRTYVPVRYLGLALNVAESDIVWDAATQKVTLTLGDKKVELTIGSTTITVNGEAKVMDVAPEIVNGRTMLPAKYVAEGLGYTVGWDAATRTVLVSK